MARKYYYDTGEEKVGPVTGGDLVSLRAQGEISDETWVRRDGSETWRPLASVNLKEEEEEAANPSLWRILTRHLPWSSIILGVAVTIVLVALLIGVIRFAWPVLLVLFIFWLLSRALR